jgi:hypothetical protein
MPKQRRGDRTKQHDSDIPPKYTHGGIKYSAKEHSQSKGWTDDGIARYNELFEFVSNDCIRYPEFMVKFKDARQQAIGTKTKQPE